MNAERARDVGDDWVRDARITYACDGAAYPATSLVYAPPRCGRTATHYLEGHSLFLCRECADEAADKGGYELEALDDE